MSRATDRKRNGAKILMYICKECNKNLGNSCYSLESNDYCYKCFSILINWYDDNE